jgi:hypothetical protein
MRRKPVRLVLLVLSVAALGFIVTGANAYAVQGGPGVGAPAVQGGPGVG